MPFLVLISCTLLIAGAACSKRPSAEPQADARELSSATPAAAPSKPRIDPCSLLTNEEIQSVQGEPVQQTSSSSQADRGLLYGQCYFALPTSSNSISLVLAARNQPGGRDPKELWNETFHREHSEKDEEREEEEEKQTPPQKIDGLGDEAFWMGGHISTALYVLKGDCFIRISVGGAVGDTQTKLDKSKKLAEFALKRL